MDVFITDGGQHNIEDAIHHRVPVLGISYSTTLEHYLRQIEKHEAGLISFIDFAERNVSKNSLHTYTYVCNIYIFMFIKQTRKDSILFFVPKFRQILLRLRFFTHVFI